MRSLEADCECQEEEGSGQQAEGVILLVEGVRLPPAAAGNQPEVEQAGSLRVVAATPLAGSQREEEAIPLVGLPQEEEEASPLVELPREEEGMQPGVWQQGVEGTPREESRVESQVEADRPPRAGGLAA